MVAVSDGLIVFASIESIAVMAEVYANRYQNCETRLLHIDTRANKSSFQPAVPDFCRRATGRLH